MIEYVENVLWSQGGALDSILTLSHVCHGWPFIEGGRWEVGARGTDEDTRIPATQLPTVGRAPHVPTSRAQRTRLAF